MCVCVRACCAESEFVTSVLPVAHLYLCVHTTARVDYTAVRIYKSLDDYIRDGDEDDAKRRTREKKGYYILR